MAIDLGEQNKACEVQLRVNAVKFGNHDLEYHDEELECDFPEFEDGSLFEQIDVEVEPAMCDVMPGLNAPRDAAEIVPESSELADI